MARNFDVLEQRIKRAREESKNGGAVIQANKKFFQESVTGANRQGEAALAAAAFVQGTQGEHLATARKHAEARLRAPLPDGVQGPTIDKPGDNTEDNLWDNLFDNQFTRATGAKTWLFGYYKSERQTRIDAEVRRGFVKSLQDTGLIGQDISSEQAINADPRSAAINARYQGLLQGNDVNLREAMHDLSPQVSAKGGNPYGGLERVEAAVKENTKAVEKTNELLQQQAPRRVPPVPPGAPGATRPLRP
jgi:hypothetical protein